MPVHHQTLLTMFSTGRGDTAHRFLWSLGPRRLKRRSLTGEFMPETTTSPWPEDFFDFAYVSVTDDRMAELTVLAEPEDWICGRTPSDHPYPILFNYIRYTYRRIAEENKIALSEDGQFACFNTGLVTPNQDRHHGDWPLRFVPAPP